MGNHSHPNKKKLNKLKINNSSKICQRIEVTGQTVVPPKLETETGKYRELQLTRVKPYKQKPLWELLLGRKFYT